MEFKFVFALLFALLCVAVSNGQDEKAEDVVQIEVIQPPPADCERKSKKNDKLSMHYVGTLTESGKKFDSSHDRGQTFDFQIGAGQVIAGWEEGLLDMCVGEKRKLRVPSTKAYGERGVPNAIPANADLSFEVELMKIEDGAPPPNVFKEIDGNDDKLLTQEEVSAYLKLKASEMSEGLPTDEKHNELVTQIFTHEDKDKDGFISHEEFSGPKHDEL